MKNWKWMYKPNTSENFRRGLALKLALILILECAWPSAALALTGGPSQPEVQSFEPIGTSDMVDLFSGDFSYNIPLFEMDGYPMNISYHSGVGMDQEASWTGLGWNINPGVINRNMRGIPDDFNGDEITKEQNVKSNQTIGISCGFSGELFGLDFATFSARLGLKYNNYNGVGMEKSFNVALTASNKYGGSGSVSLGINSSSDDGLTLSPAVSLSQSTSKTEKKGTSLGISVGTSFNSRGGLSALSISPEITMNMDNSKNKAGKDVNHAVSKGLNGARFNFMQSTYSPSLDFPMHNLSITASVKFGAEIYGFAGSLSPMAYYAEQSQIKKSITRSAYGYMNAHNGQFDNLAMMDFNREKDGSFSTSTYNLPITNLTYDIYSVSGQGTGGSYRPFRSDVGHVFDVSSYSTSDGGSASVELGAGGIFKTGADIIINSAYSHSGDWSSSSAAQTISFQGGGNYPGYEPYYFKEANERSVNSDPAFLTRYGGFGPVRPQLDGEVEFDVKTTGNLVNKNGGVINVSNTSYRKARDKRSQTINTLTNKEVYDGMGLFGGSSGSGVKNDYIANNIAQLGHHIGQITSLNTDGRRYVYSLPVYNKEQREMNFAVGEPVGGGSARSQSGGLVTYGSTDITTGNKMGLDNYFNNTIMPPFAHSYMLTAVLSSDYVDLTGNGPTDDDMGNYTLFQYNDQTASQDYKWRTPVETNKAKFSQGLLADLNDDKGSIVYGTKQLFYLNKIITKNHVADFVLSARDDGKGVNGVNGGINSSASQLKIDRIILKAKAANKVIKTVHFAYNYNLCPNTPNSVGAGAQGKLTLDKLYFTYQNSEKGAYNAYSFTYGGINPAYDQNAYDRWGNYKGVNPTAFGSTAPPKEFFPYTNQYESKSTIDANSSAWHLTKIGLPSGGEINVAYESDDYAFVQDKQAAQMYLWDDGSGVAPTFPYTMPSNFTFKFKIPSGAPANVKIEDFLPDNRMVFFKFKMRIRNALIPANDLWDYVPGYAEVDMNNFFTKINGTTGEIRFKSVTVNDANGATVPPMVKAAIQFGRLNTSRQIYDQPNASSGIGEQVIKALVNSSFFNNMSQVVAGPNQYLYLMGRGKEADLSCSWIKLKNVTGVKYGGGSRVKSIKLNDNFNAMTSGAEQDSEYGQIYEYTKNHMGRIISSGVAAYEPQIGGEENSLKEPFFTETKKLLAPDDDHYMEAPFGECFFPSASVGYSEVKVKNYIPAIPAGKSLSQHGTGYVVNEFYTAKDFPTITDRTELESVQHKSDPANIESLLSIETKDYMTASQGFYVELNDMHGKPKATRTFNNYSQEITSTEYFYKSEIYAKGGKRLKNNVTVIKPTGSVTSAEVGVFFDAVGDLREQSTESETDNVNINVDAFVVLIPIAVVVPIPTFSSDKTQFRSATMTKVVQRFGILEKTVVKMEGSTVTNTDLAYDSETGQVLLSQTTNGFNDPEYNFKYPAYWYNPVMGLASKNIGYELQTSFSGGQATLLAGQNLFVPGDELQVKTSTAVYKYWVTKSFQNKIEIKDMAGGNAPSGNVTIKVIRSGYKNMQTMDMANISTLVNPINSISSNIYQKVISSNAIEYGNSWGTNCDCINTTANINPYTNGTAGIYRPLRNFQYLTDRGQTNTQGNSNIRVDGLYTSYTPFYKNVGGKWLLNPDGWTFTSQVTEFNSSGQELENIDALGRYSAATFGFNQSLPTAVGANTRYRELGYEGFEDLSINGCADKHFRFDMSGYAPYYSEIVPYGHTGKRCLKLKDFGSGGPGERMMPMFKLVSKECEKADECPIQVYYNSTNSRYEISSGVAPYVFDVEKTGGAGNIVLSADGLSFTINNQGGFKCKLMVIDSKGCVVNKLILPPYTN